MPVFEIYSYGNVAVLAQIFNGVAAIMGGNDYQGLLKTLALIGFMLFLAVAVAKMRMDLGHWLFHIILLNFLLLVPKTPIAIVDKVGTQPPVVVANVPLSLAIFGHATSKIGDWLTTQYETALTLPNEIKYQGNGMMFGDSLLSGVNQASISDPILKNDIEMFVGNCAFYDINLYRLYTLEEIAKSNDLVRDLFEKTNKTLFTQWHQDGSVKNDTCNVAAEDLKKNFVAESNTVTSRMAAKFFPAFYKENANNAQVKFLTATTSAYAYMTNTGSDASTIIQNAMLANMWKGSEATIAKMDNDAIGAAEALARTQTEMTTLNTYKQNAHLAQTALPLLRNVMQAIIIVLFPVMVMLLFIGGPAYSGKILSSYVMALFWIELWPPLYAIINGIATANSASNVFSLVHASGGDPNMLNNFDIVETSLSAMSVASNLLWSVPVIAGAIVKGSFDGIASALHGSTSSAQSAAAGAAQSQTTGNYSFGNRSFDTLTGNKTDLSESDSSPFIAKTTDARGDTYTQGVRNSAVSELMNNRSISAVSTKSQVDSMNKIASAQISSALSQQTTSSNEARAGLTKASGQEWTRIKTALIGQGFSEQEAAAVQASLSQSKSAAKGAGKAKQVKDGQNNETKTTATMSAGASIGTSGVNVQLGANVQAQSAESQSHSKTDTLSTQNTTAEEDKATALKKFDQLWSSSKEFRTAIQGATSKNSSVQASLGHAAALAETSSAALTQAQTLTEQASRLEQQGYTVSRDEAKDTNYNNKIESLRGGDIFNSQSNGPPTVDGIKKTSEGQELMANAAKNQADIKAKADIEREAKRFAAQANNSPPPKGLGAGSVKKDGLEKKVADKGATIKPEIQNAEVALTQQNKDATATANKAAEPDILPVAVGKAVKKLF